VAVVLPDGRRSAYRYLPDGRVVYSRAAGDGEAQALHFDYRIDPSAAASGRSSGQALGEPGGGARGGETADAIAGSSGVTTLRTDGRVRATYRWTRAHAGSPARLLSAVGPGCARCPLTGRHYRYDHAGRVVEIRAGTTSGSDAAGPTLVIRRDPDGRPLELRWGSGADRRVRIAWRDEPLLDVPAGIDRPSVVPGLRASLEPVRDTRGRVVAIEETGYAPTLDDKGKPDPKAAIRLRRVSASPSAAMSVPRMPEAPMSGDAQARLWRDDFGRAVALRSPDFGLVRRRFDDSNRLEFERRADGSTAHYRYDADGRLIEYRETSPPRSDDTPPTRSDDTPPDAPANTPANTPANAAPQASSRAHGAITRFHWSQGRLTRVENEDQNEWLATDADGRVVGRHIALRLESGRVVEFDTHFEYDAAGRLRAWSLPGGGWIRARADSAGQTVSLEWQPTETAFSLPLLSALERDRFGLRRAVFGNGVAATLRRAAGGRLAEISHRSTRGVGRGQDIVRHGFVFDGDGRLRAWRRGPDLRTYLYDAQGRLLQASQRSQSADRTWRFAYDVNGNRLLAQRDATRVQPSPRQSTERFETIAPGNRLRRMPFQQAPSSEAAMRPGAGGQANQANHMQRAPATWDAAGRLIADAGRSYRWDAGGHLREVREAGRSVARYRYDARGLRIAKLVDGVATHYLYDPQRRLLAELDAHGEILRQYVYLADRPVAILDRAQVSPGRPAPAGVPRRIRYLHLNHLGAPEAVTDERARVIWRADYAPFGRRLDARPEGTSNREAPLGQAPHFGSDPHVRPQSAFELALRLPGQYEDRETGLHYNDHRYYDPDTGRYLSPDPLGLAGGPNPYVYAGNDPLTRVDPSGLLLFAFDGTGNGDPPARSDDWSNVYKLSRAYADGRVWYMAGVGRDDPASGILTNATDAIVAGTATARVDYLLTELEAAVSAPSARGAPVDVDVIGFSRGAAMARDFSNRVADRISRGTFGRLGACVRLRFLGLWDTVAQFGPDGLANIGWRLSVPVETAYAAQAVALNEHRTLFPAESIAGSPLAGVRIERGFVGAHSDVGGSYAEGDLSDVALIWMHEQARLAGAHMFALTSEYARVTAPLLHDSNTDGVGDREFRYRNSWGWVFANPVQRVARVDGLQWRDTGQFISRLATPGQDVYGEPTIAGSVDMRSYSEWLMANYAIDVEWEP
jgi:RHS repeat-associated protein